METGVTDAEKPVVDVNNSSDVVRGEGGNYSRWRKRKRRSSRGVDDILFKKSKTTTDEGNNADSFVKISAMHIWL